jgi:hypothetical protein
MATITVRYQANGTNISIPLGNKWTIKNVKQNLATILSMNPESFQLWVNKNSVGTFLHDNDSIPSNTILDYYIKGAGTPDLNGTFNTAFSK